MVTGQSLTAVNGWMEDVGIVTDEEEEVSSVQNEE